MSEISTVDEQNKMYVAFVKAFAPVLLHLYRTESKPRASRRSSRLSARSRTARSRTARSLNARSLQTRSLPNIANIIKELKDLDDDATPNRASVASLKKWVNTKQSEIDRLTSEEIDKIIAEAKTSKSAPVELYENEYSVPRDKRTRGDPCTITMDPFNRDEYVVETLDNGKPYKVAAILRYYTLMKESNIDGQSEWMTPLRNKLTPEQIESLEDLNRWYNTKPFEVCKRRRTRSRSVSGGRRISRNKSKN